MNSVLDFLTRTRGKNRLETVDVLTYLYLLFGTIIMFGPVVWLVMSSFKSQTDLIRFPPTFFPYRQETVVVEGHDKPLELYTVTFEDGTVRQMAQVRRVGIEAQMIDPATPTEIVKVNINQRAPMESVYVSLENYTNGMERFNFWTYLKNTVFVTTAATILTLFVNSMAAFALSKYQFRGRDIILLLTICTLMVPLSVILIPVFLVITQIGWNNNLLGIIVPAAATPTGVFLLRQYMLTIPDELIDSARIDGASEWRIYLQIILPLARPALAVLTIFSIMWRVNSATWRGITATLCAAPRVVSSHSRPTRAT